MRGAGRALITHVRNEVHWNDQVSRSELVSPEPIRQGSRFKTVNRGNEYDAVLSVYDRPRALAFEARPNMVVLQLSPVPAAR